jgi:tetratricopeptide (TPR) repeat protein
VLSEIPMNTQATLAPQFLFKQATSFHQEGMLAESLASYNRALALQPNFFEALFNRGMLLREMQRENDALTSLDQALAVKPDHAGVWNNRGNVLRKLERFDEALASFDRALALNPNFPDAHYNRGNLLLRDLKRGEEAFRAYDKAVTLRPDFVEAWNNRAMLLLDMQRQDDALASLDQALAVRPDHAGAWNNRGNVLRNMKRYDEALASFDRALALQPNFPNALYNRGNILLMDLKRGEDALPACEMALSLRPDFVEAWNDRGYALYGLGRFSESLASYDKAVSLRQNYPEAWKNRGHVLFEMDQIDEAIAAFLHSATLAYGAGQNPLDQPADPNLPSHPHKLRHDREQHDYQVSIGGKYADKPGARLAGPAVTPGNAIAAEEWRTKKPQIAVVDDLLTPEALEGLRRFCLEQPVWRKSYESGYLGSFPEHGFACPLLGQIARELRAAFPDIFRTLPLRYMWGFKYDSKLAGINIHADEAAVNVNFWLTPDEANLDPKSGGLVVWDMAAPPEWDFDTFNGNTGAMRDFLARKGARSLTVPYRANRAVIFDSDLFHETDKIRFKDGYLNRRINVTMLFGQRQRACVP